MRLLLSLCLLLIACTPRASRFACERDDVCVFQGVQGICEPSGDCSFVDASCALSGRRYGAFTSLGAVCVGAEGRPFTLRVSVEGAGAGRVVSEPPGIDCAGACSASADFAPGTEVVLTATNQDGARKVHFEEDCSGAASACTLAMTSPRNARVFLDGNNYMFIARTVLVLDSGLLSPSFLDTLDGVCQNGATDPQGNALLPGTFRAWASSATVNARDRLGGARGWIRPDGRPFADRIEDLLTDFEMFYPPRLDVDGGDVGTLNVNILTATTSSGTVGESCASWSSSAGSVTIGNPTSGGRSWTSQDNIGCSGNNFRVYCFGTDLSATAARPVAPPSDARRAFVTAEGHALLHGRTEADEICQADATAAGLSGSFKALLASTSASAISRFDVDKAPWYRVDDVRLVPRASDLTSARLVFEAPLNVDAQGRYLASGSVWAGAPNVATPGGDGACADFTATVGQGIGGLLASSSPFGGFTPQCGTTGYIYCFEE